MVSRQRVFSQRLMALSSLLAAVTIAGCTVGPNYNRPTAPVPAKFDIVEPWREAVPKDSVPKTTWWTVFRDDDLNLLETQLLASNQTLKVALAHYDQARASAAIQNAQLFPTASVNPSIGSQRYSGNRPTGSSLRPSGSVTQYAYTLPCKLSY